MSADFVHLRVHSEYSLKDSTIRIFDQQKNNLIMACKRDNQQAIALTDEVNLFAMVAFYKHAIMHGIKPIIGAELWVRVGSCIALMPLYAMNKRGYGQLCTLISSAWMQRKGDDLPMIDVNELAKNCDQLIALCGATEGVLAPLMMKQGRSIKPIERELQRWLELFEGRFYLEIQRIGRDREENWIDCAVSLSERYQVPLVATNKVCFLNELDFRAHEARVCIYRRTQLGNEELEGLYTTKQSLRSSVEMMELFADLPSATKNSVLIAERCNVEGILGEVKMPSFTIQGDDIEVHFRTVVQQGLTQRLAALKIVEQEKIQVYRQRLEVEMATIVQMKYIGYFLIVADFIQWAKKQAIPVGPGRGSGAGSLVAYVLKITDVDPIRFDLIFERFLNIERKSMPDFDIDFCVRGRDRVIDYVVQKYGTSQVAQIITFGSLSAKAVVRDVSRILGLPYAVGDKISKLIPNQLDITIDKAFELSKEFTVAYNTDEEMREVVDLSLQLEGLVRNVGKHAGGIVIAPDDLQNFCPVYVDSDDKSKVTQFHKDALEDIGLVKFDFLGLKNLTAIDYTIQWINHMDGQSEAQANFSVDDIDYNDQAVYQTLSDGQTMGVFQLESGGIRRYTMQLKPTTIDHLTDMLALYRPGPLNSGMVDKYMNHREGKERKALLDASLEPILQSTNGVIIYQEQVMKIAQLLAGFSLGNADVLRQAMGKKNQQKMAQQKINFLKGAQQNGIHPNVASAIFEQMEKFAEYGFNKSHSVAYALLSYQTAYLKYHFKAAYMASVMSLDSGSPERLHELKQHCEDLGLSVKMIDINQSKQYFVPLNEREIRWSLSAIKGVGEVVAELITKERQASGPYKDFFDFCKRVGARSSNGKVILSKRVLEMLIYSGAFDSLHDDRIELLANIERGISYIQDVSRNQSIGQGDLFAHVSTVDISTPEYLPASNTVPILELLHFEKQITGIYLRQSPYSIFYQEVKHYDVLSIEQFMQFNQQQGEQYSREIAYPVLGEIERLRTNRKIQKIASNKKATVHQGDDKERLMVTMEIRIGDGRRNIECVIRDEQLQDKIYANNWFNKQLLLIFVGTPKYDDITKSNSLEVVNVYSIQQLRNHLLEKIIFSIQKEDLPILANSLKRLQEHSHTSNGQVQRHNGDACIDGSVDGSDDLTGGIVTDAEKGVMLEMTVKEEIGEVVFTTPKIFDVNDNQMVTLLTNQRLPVTMAKKNQP